MSIKRSSSYQWVSQPKQFPGQKLDRVLMRDRQLQSRPSAAKFQKDTMHYPLQTFSLEKALSYCNDDVAHHFTKLYEVSFEEANDIFIETKKWLWLSAQAQAHHLTTTVSLKDALYILDEMWHNFLLFTEDYSHFCLDYLGVFIPHTPIRLSQQETPLNQDETSREKIQKENMQSLQRQCLFICQQLGADTLFKWFVEFPERYTAEFFKYKRCDISPQWKPPAELKALAIQIKSQRRLTQPII